MSRKITGHHLGEGGHEARVTPPPVEVAAMRKEVLAPEERRQLMLTEAEKQGVTMETLALLSMVGMVDGFTNLGAIYGSPTQAMIDGERIRGAKTEAQARSRAWRNLRKDRARLDLEMRETGTGYARPSDWFRLFAALKKATNPGAGIPDVFSVKTAAERAAFRQWADKYALNGDGLVRTAQVIEQEFEGETGTKFDKVKAINKIQAFTAEQLNEIVKAGFESSDTYLRYEDEYVPMLKMSSLFDRAQLAIREREIRGEVENRVQGGAFTKEGKEKLTDELTHAYDVKHFKAVRPDRNSTAAEMSIIAGVFATTVTKGQEAVGYGYHGITEPEVIKLLPPGYISEQRSKPYVSHNGKTVVRVERQLFGKSGIPLMSSEEAVEGEQKELLEREQTRKIAEAIVNKKFDRDRDGYVRTMIHEPFYWNDVHHKYKLLTEKRLPLLAKIAHVDPAPLQRFVGEEAENDWMYNRILSSGAISDKELDDKKKHFELSLQDIYPEGSDRTALEEAAAQYPEFIELGHHPFSIQYVWSGDQQTIAKAIIEIKADVYGNAHHLINVVPAQIPKLGSKEHPVDIVFKYKLYDYSQPMEFPPHKYRELLELIEPNKRFIERKWDDFRRLTEAGKLDIPLIITAKDAFPTNKEIDMLLAPHPESVVYATDRDGVEQRAYVTIMHVRGDDYRMCYAANQAASDELLEAAMQVHAKRQAALKTREAMGSEFDEKLTEVRKLQKELEAFNKEFEEDNLVAFVLQSPPYPESEQKYVQERLDNNEIASAELALGNQLRDRQRTQEIIDQMRNVSKLIEELEALGFDWQRYDINKRNHQQFSDDDYGWDMPRKDSRGFFPGDIRLRTQDVYHPSMGRITGYRTNPFIKDELVSLKRRLEYELEVWKQKKQHLRDERAKSADTKAGSSEPEVIRRGRPKISEEENE